ncbi:MAG: HNH endonuclease [Sphingomonadales bacterium]|nr:MAG: HNH endonuclease [Sphingomonadales bacterium]
MSKATYEDPRPSIPAGVARLVLVEAGHACAVKECRDHTYIELHHIDENRENNNPANLIVLCDRHHKMAHAGKIDRMALRMYKDLLANSRDAEILARLERLEAQRTGEPTELPVAESSDEQPVDTGIRKLSATRWAVQQFALSQVAITKYEQEAGIYFERHVELLSGDKRLVLDALKQFDGDAPDVIIDFCYIRKSYLDASAYGAWFREKLEVYEMMTGRKAVGVLLVVVGRERMLEEGGIPMIRQSVVDNEGVSLQVYSCEQVGFHPGPISAGVI